MQETFWKYSQFVYKRYVLGDELCTKLCFLAERITIWTKLNAGNNMELITVVLHAVCSRRLIVSKMIDSSREKHILDKTECRQQRTSFTCVMYWKLNCVQNDVFQQDKHILGKITGNSMEVRAVT